MPGGWTLSMAWMPMCGQTWAGAAAAFVGMWAVMMAAMMSPSLAPVLWRYARALRARGERRRVRLAALAGVGYLSVWTVLGAGIFALGAALTQAALQMPAMARAVPVSIGVVVLLAGLFQFTPQKARHLDLCRMARHPRELALRANIGAAWRYGLRLGLQCSRACAGLTAILLVMGVMDWGPMLAVTAAVSAERLAPESLRVAQVVGGVAVAVGMYVVGQAAGLA